MADDDVDVQGSRRVGAERRTPRFSWNPAYEQTFFRSLCESVQMGFKENHSFKSAAWDRAAIALRDKHGAYPEKSHLINKSDNARKKFRMWRALREDKDFLYNPATKMVTAPEEAWQRHFQREPLCKALRGRPFEHEEFMEILYPDVIGSGGAPKRIMKRKRNTEGADASEGQGSPAVNHTQDQSFSNPSPSRTTRGATQTTIPLPPQAPPQQPSRPASATIPPRNSNGQASVLPTPPDEHVPSSQNSRRARIFPDPNAGAAAAAAAAAAAVNSPQMDQRRRRPTYSTNIHTATSNASVLPGVVEDSVMALAEALKARNSPRWPDQAVEIFFRDFADEDPDLQLKIAEKALTDENKAMVFCKMTPALRRHWVGRLREVHQRNLGNLGQVGMGGPSVMEMGS